MEPKTGLPLVRRTQNWLLVSSVVPGELNQRVFQVSGHRRPVVPLEDERACRRFEPPPAVHVAQECDDRAREGLRLVREPHVLAVRDRQPFGADARGHDRFRHRHGFEDLQARAAADPERHDVHGRVPHIRPHIVDAAGDDDAGLPAERGHRRRRRAADDRQRHVRLFARG